MEWVRLQNYIKKTSELIILWRHRVKQGLESGRLLWVCGGSEEVRGSVGKCEAVWGSVGQRGAQWTKRTRNTFSGARTDEKDWMWLLPLISLSQQAPSPSLQWRGQTGVRWPSTKYIHSLHDDNQKDDNQRIPPPPLKLKIEIIIPEETKPGQKLNSFYYGYTLSTESSTDRCTSLFFCPLAMILAKHWKERPRTGMDGEFFITSWKYA